MSTGSYDEASNLVQVPTSPLFSGANDVFEKSDDNGAQPHDKSDIPDDGKTLTATKGSRTPSPKQSPFKKSKASKGLGFLIKAREGAKKGRKSPLSFKSFSKSKKHHSDDDFDDFGPDAAAEGTVDEKVKAKSEHWQAFLQMQDRIKENVLKTQSSIGKLTSGRVSPSGRISPGKGKDDDDSNIRFTSLTQQDSLPLEKEDFKKTGKFREETEDSNENLNNLYDSSDLSNLISLPHLTVSSPSAFQTLSATDTKFDMDLDAFADISSSTTPVNTGSNTTGSANLIDEFDLLGLNSAPPPSNNRMSTQSSLNEDLLGLEDLLSQPVSRDMSQDNLTCDWFGGSSTAQSSAQSSLCPSPVQFDMDLLTTQGRLAPESTAVSDLARSLVDDFLQWGAGNADEPLSKNPFSSDDFTSDQSYSANSFNPFATIVESDDTDNDFTSQNDKIPSWSAIQDRKFDPFQTKIESLPEPASAISGLDPFAPQSSAVISASLDINANAAPLESHVPIPPLRPAQPTSKKSSRKTSNPFLVNDDDLANGPVTFDDNFFASRGIFHAPVKDVWGVPSTSGTAQTAVNPFQDDLFTSDNILPASGFADGFGEPSTIGQPINPFLTASFENIAIQAQCQPLSADNPFASMVSGKSPVLSPAHSPAISPSHTSASADTSKVSAFDELEFISVNRTENVESLVDKSGQDNVKTANDDLDFLGLDNTKAVTAAVVDDDFSGGLKFDIRAKSALDTSGPVPMLPPPPKAPKSPLMPQRENPFNKESPPEENFATFAEIEEEIKKKEETEAAEQAALKEKLGRMKSLTSEDSTPEEEGPLEPLEPFHLQQDKEFWKLMIRQPTKKKLAGNRFWKTCIVRLGQMKDGPVVRMYMDEKDTDPFQELPIQPCYSISDISMQQYDQFGKIHTVKIQYIFYRERVGIRPERITPSFVRKPKPNMILDHAPQVSELIKLGCLDIDEITSFVWAMEDLLMKLECHRDKTLNYTKEEVQAEVWDEYFAVVDKDSHVTSQKARVRIFFLAFLTGMPTCELGISDRRRKGKEVVGRHDIIPVRTEDWIRIEEPEFHHVVDLETYEKTHNIRFTPLDACQFELVRFRVRPRANRELPLQLRITQVMKARHFEVRVDLLVTGYHAFSKKCGQFPCEDIEVRIKIPEVWIYYFRYEKRFGYGSLKAMARKPGRIKGLERITMMAQGLLTPALMEASVGSAKYEHLYRSVVWRIPRLPERNHGAYKNHLFVLHLSLGQHDEIPDQLDQWADCSFTMPASTVSKAQVRSISVENPDPPEKWVRYIAKYNYKVEIDNHVETESDKETSD